jgi:hypothetical protein
MGISKKALPAPLNGEGCAFLTDLIDGKSKSPGAKIPFGFPPTLGSNTERAIKLV